VIEGWGMCQGGQMSDHRWCLGGICIFLFCLVKFSPSIIPLFFPCIPFPVTYSEVVPLYPARRSGESCTLPLLARAEPDRQTLFMHFESNKKLSYRRVTARCVLIVSSNLASCHATVQKLFIRQVLTKLMV